jgi:hypothetical protein
MLKKRLSILTKNGFFKAKNIKIAHKNALAAKDARFY